MNSEYTKETIRIIYNKNNNLIITIVRKNLFQYKKILLTLTKILIKNKILMLINNLIISVIHINYN